MTSAELLLSRALAESVVVEEGDAVFLSKLEAVEPRISAGFAMNFFQNHFKYSFDTFYF